MKTNNLILQTITKLVAFIILAYSIYLFLSGHHKPGGGFIAGLMTSGALVLMYLAFDQKTINRALPYNFRNLAGIGVLTAVLTGIGGPVLGYPFLTHSFGYVQLPILGNTEWSTAVLFDLGVYMTVIGITLTIILAIGEDT
ncbi:MAG: Na(+)/H(+) antiporter subunit B [Thermincolia bacterium]